MYTCDPAMLSSKRKAPFYPPLVKEESTGLPKLKKCNLGTELYPPLVKEESTGLPELVIAPVFEKEL